MPDNQINKSVKRRDDIASFKRLATKRANNAMKYIRLLGNLSNKSNYSYTYEDTKKIFSALRKTIDDVEECFNRAEPKRKFVLED